jgi:hypothetical protein
VSDGFRQLDDLRPLLIGLMDGQLGKQERLRLSELLRNDPAARTYYLQHVLTDALLRLEHRTSPSEAEEMSEALQQGPGIPTPQAPLTAAGSSLLSLSSPLGSFLFSYAAATLIVGVGILIAWMCHVSEPRLSQQGVAVAPSAPVPRPGAPGQPEREIVSVARVTDMVDIEWADARLAPSTQRIRLGEKFALALGLMEITYDTGAKVVLQGPCTYTVESRSGGYLERGRLTARVESAVGSRQSAVSNTTPTYRTSSSNSLPTADCRLPTLFSVRTPTAVVNDLGTEFGVEVDKNNGSGVCVFVGAVEFVPTDKSSGGVRVAAGESRRISASNGGAIERIAFDHNGFTKPRAMLAGEYRKNKTLFHETFAAFALGTRWRAANEGPPDDVLKAVTDNGRHALWMKNKAAKDKFSARAIETVDPFPLQDLAAIEVHVVFRAGEDAPPPFQVWLLGSSK